MTNPRTIARIQSRILERIAYCLQCEVRDPRAGFITITRVELNADLSIARVFWSVLGDSSERSKSEHMLAHASGFIRRQMARVLDMRRIPDLRFEFDESLEKAAELDSLIRAARARDRAINPHLAAEDAAQAAESAESADEETASEPRAEAADLEDEMDGDDGVRLDGEQT